MTHPLTNDIIEEISVSYLKNCESVKSNMRSAADWQLEQCVEELECLLSIFGATGVIKEEAVPTMVELFKANMRPQENN